jgi:hypothetical protein
MTSYTNFIRSHIHLFQQPEAFLPFNNRSFGNPSFDDATYRVLIVRLSPFRDIDRSTPHLFLFQQVRRAMPKAYIDLAFLPSRAERELFAQNAVPYLIGTQSMRSADTFDLVLISNAYTLELINLPFLLLHSDIPCFASQRGLEWPIFILGGSNAMATQSIIRSDGDCLVDAIFAGEGEGVVGELVCHLVQHRGEDKRQALIDFSTQHKGLWAAGAFYAVEKAVLRQPQVHFLLTDPPILNSPEARTAHLQIDYGCPAFCSFCFEGYDRKPYRELALSDLITAARRVKRSQGCEALNLYSFDFNAHCSIFDLLLVLDRLFDRVSLKSQRIDLLEHTPPLLEAEIEVGKRSFTLGIEGISERQRAWLHKSLPTADIMSLLRQLYDRQVREIKLFYILTGHETDQDMTEFRAFVQKLKRMRRQRRRVRVIFSFGLLIRMPFTPLRYDRLILVADEWKLLIGQIKSACETNGFEFRLAFDWSTYCTSQVLAMGGYWLVEPLLMLAEKGYCFDTTLPDAYWQELQSWMKRTRHWNQGFLGDKGPEHVFALDFMSSDISSRFLYEQFLACQANADDGYCLGNRCLGCNACADVEQRRTITEHHIHQPEPTSYLAQLKRTAVAKRTLKPLYLRLYTRLAGVVPEFVEAMVLRELFERYPDWIDNLLSVRESLFTARTNRARYPPLAMEGESVFALKGWELESIRYDLKASCPIRLQTFDILDIVDHFAPGEYRALQLEITLPTSHFSEPRKQLEKYLRSTYLPYSLQRQDRGYIINVPPKGRKKKVLLGGHLASGKEHFVANLNVGTKFNLMSFLAQFDIPNAYHYAQVAVLKIDF